MIKRFLVWLTFSLSCLGVEETTKLSVLRVLRVRKLIWCLRLREAWANEKRTWLSVYTCKQFVTDKSAFGSVPAGKIKLPKRIPKSTLILPCPKSKYSQLKRILKNKTNKKRIFLALFSLRLELSEYRRLYSFTTLTDKSGFIRCALRAFFYGNTRNIGSNEPMPRCKDVTDHISP